MNDWVNWLILSSGVAIFAATFVFWMRWEEGKNDRLVDDIKAKITSRKKDIPEVSEGFEIYKKEVIRLIKLLNIGTGWSVYFSDEESKDSENSAQVITDTIDYTVTFWFNVNASTDLLDSIKSARHEVGHFICAKMGALARSRCVTPNELDAEFERMANFMGDLIGRLK